MVTVVVCFWSDPLQLSESRQNYYIWEVCSAIQWDALKSEMPSVNRTMKVCLILHIHLTSHQPATTSSSISTTILQGECFHNQQDAENAFQEFIRSWSTDLYATGRNKLISYWQNCVDCNGSYLINRDMAEPSYNYLNFKVQNLNYFYTNLMFSWSLVLICLEQLQLKTVQFPS